MTQQHARWNRRSFLKGLGVAAVGSVLVPGALNRVVSAQAFTSVSLYPRLAGATRPAMALNGFDTEAWICLGDQVELFWLTTSDVHQIDLGDELGVFPADQGGREDGLNWGSIVVEPTNNASYQIRALDGDYGAAAAGNVRVFGRPSGEGPFSPFDEATFSARRISNTSSRVTEPDEWFATLSSDIYSPRLRVRSIKPTGAAVIQDVWRVLKIDEDGTERRFSLGGQPNFQNPFSPANANVTIPLAGTWSFITRGDVAERDVAYTAELLCA